MKSNRGNTGGRQQRPLRKPTRGDRFVALEATTLMALLTATLSASAGCTDRPPPDPLTPTGMCAVPATTRAAPYATQFQFRNDGAAPLFLHQGCIGIDYGISSCASQFRDSLGPTFHCACSCADPGCTGNVACGPCPEPQGVTVAAGASLPMDWNALLVTDESRRTYQCVNVRALPAGRYRVAIRVHDSAEAARNNSTGGRVVTRDFELPAAGDVVDVPLGASPQDACDATPDAAAPVCAGAQPRDVACSLATSLAFAWEGGLALSQDAATIAPPATYTRTRTFLDQVTPARQCTAAIPRCARDARVVTTGDLEQVLAQPGVADAFASPLPVYGYDPRPHDGSILVLRRPDGKSLGLGDDCSACPGLVAAPYTAPLRAARAMFLQFNQQMLNAPTCSDFRL